jgi:hypothetical protein
MNKKAGSKKVITLDDEEVALLKEASRQRAVPSTQIIRDALRSYCVKALEYPEFTNSPITYDEFIKSLTITEELQLACSCFSISLLAEGFAKIEKNDLRVAEVYLNAMNYSDVRKWGRDTLDIETLASELRKGIMAHCWGAHLIVSKKMPPNTVLILSEEQARVGCILHLIKEEEGAKINRFRETLETINQHSKNMSALIKKLMEEIQD